MIFRLHGHKLNADGGAGGFGGEESGVNDQRTHLGGVENQFPLLCEMEHGDQGALVAVCTGELAAVGSGGITGEFDAGGLAVLKEEEQGAAVISGEHHEDNSFVGVHGKLGGQIVAQSACLGILEVVQTAFVDLLAVGEEHDFRTVCGFESLEQLVFFLVLLCVRHTQGLRGDLLEVTTLGEEDIDGIIGNIFFFVGSFDLMIVGNGGAAIHGVLLLDVLQLANDDLADAVGVCHKIAQIVDFVAQGFFFLHALQNVLLVDVAQLDLGNILCLHFVDAEANHQIGDDFAFFFGFANDRDGLIDVQQDALKTLQQVQFFLLFVQREVHAAADGIRTPGAPFFQKFTHAHNAGHSGDQDVEVAADGVLQSGGFEELCHEFIGIHAALQIDRQFQTGKIGLVTHIVDLFQLAGFDQLGNLIDDRFCGGGIGDLVDLDDIFALDIAVLSPDLDGAAAAVIHILKGGTIIEDLAAGREIGSQKSGGEIAVGIFQEGDGGIADFAQIETAELRGHTDSDALVGAHQNIGEGGGQKSGLLHGVIVVVDKVHGVLIDIAEQLGTDGGKLCLSVSAGGPCHVAGVDFTEVSLAVHEGVEQRVITLGKADHGVINSAIAMGVQTHGLPHDVGGFGAPAGEQSHLVHGVEQLAVAGLEAIDFRNSAGNDGGHGVGHEVGLQCVGDGIFHHLGTQTHDIGIIDFFCTLFGELFLSHSSNLSLLVVVERVTQSARQLHPARSRL